MEKVCTHVGVLKKGKVIASGKVDELLKTDNVIIIGTDRPVDLKEALLDAGIIRSATLSGSSLEVIPTEGHDSAAINRLAYEKGITISELRVRKSTLEEQFLELVKK